MDFTESHNDPGVGVWKFICALILLLLNMYGKSIKNEIEQEYTMRKVVETYLFMKEVPLVKYLEVDDFEDGSINLESIIET